jgi:hypothetical protein
MEEDQEENRALVGQNIHSKLNAALLSNRNFPPRFPIDLIL